MIHVSMKDSLSTGAGNHVDFDALNRVPMGGKLSGSNTSSGTGGAAGGASGSGASDGAGTGNSNNGNQISI